MSESWLTVPLVFVTRPACPICGSPEYAKVRTDSNGDGSATKKVICKGCGGRYKIVLELPVSGKSELDTAIVETQRISVLGRRATAPRRARRALGRD